jgi:hypothetical protein
MVHGGGGNRKPRRLKKTSGVNKKLQIIYLRSISFMVLTYAPASIL